MIQIYHTVTLYSDNDTYEVETVAEYDCYTAQELARHAVTLLRYKYKLPEEEILKIKKFKIRPGRKGR